MFIKIESGAAVILGAVLLFAAAAFLYPAQVQSVIGAVNTFIVDLLTSIANTLAG